MIDSITSKPNLKTAALLGSVYFTLIIFLTTTNPRQLSLLLLFVPFGLIFAGVFLPVSLLLKKARDGEAGRREYATSGCVAALPTLLMLLGSIDQLTMRDTLLLLAVICVAVFYVRRMALPQAQ